MQQINLTQCNKYYEEKSALALSCHFSLLFIPLDSIGTQQEGA